MEKWQLQAVKREGYAGVWRAGRHWPSNAPVEVEVLDEGDDPKVEITDAKAPGGKRMALDPTRLSRASFEQVLKDGRISKFRVGDDTASQDVPALRAEVADLKAQLAQASGEIGRLQAALAGKITERLLHTQALEPGTPPAQASIEAEALAKNPPAAPAPPEPEPEFHQDDHHPTQPGKKPRR